MSEFNAAQRVLDDAIAARIFPGAVAEIGSTSGARATLARGWVRYDETADAVTAGTIYDLASLTKVLATTPIVLHHVLEGRMRLEDRVSRWIPEWTQPDRESVTLQDLLEHCSGLPGHRRYFQTLRGREAFETAIANEPLDNQPRWQSIYSDPGFMLLGFAIERATESSLDALFSAWRDRELKRSTAIGFLPVAALSRIAPTEVSSEGETWGRVHDENAAALGGIAAHAGLFATAEAVGDLARWWLEHITPAATGSANAVIQRFVRKSAVPGSSRALGWDTMLPSSSCGARLSASAIGHTGFTGTSLWIDPDKDLYVVLLSNRVHPGREGDGIQTVRRAFHDAVVSELA